MTIYNPELWLETTVRGVKDYVLGAVDTDVYDVIMEFPGPLLDSKELPLRKTLIHFEIDDMASDSIGMGDRPTVESYDEANQLVTYQWASIHTINFDVGVWASDASGGTTSRMRAMQILQSLFGLPHGYEKLAEATDGDDGVVEIISYSGGNFTIDTVNDMRVYRVINAELVVRVFSRTPLTLSNPVSSIESIEQAPDLTITE